MHPLQCASRWLGAISCTRVESAWQYDWLKYSQWSKCGVPCHGDHDQSLHERSLQALALCMWLPNLIQLQKTSCSILQDSAQSCMPSQPHPDPLLVYWERLLQRYSWGQMSVSDSKTDACSAEHSAHMNNATWPAVRPTILSIPSCACSSGTFCCTFWPSTISLTVER